MVDIILACGGNGSRAGLGYNKLKFDIGGMSVLEKTLSAFSRDDVNAIYIPCSPDDKEWISAIAQNSHLQIIVCDGGASRTQSVWNALSAINRNENSNQENFAFQSQTQCQNIAKNNQNGDENSKNIAENCPNSGENRQNIAEKRQNIAGKLQQNTHFALIHDGARPFVSQQLIDRVISNCEQFGSAIPCLPCSDSLRQLGAQNDNQSSHSTNNNQNTNQLNKTSNTLDINKNDNQAS
ncbi:MAG: 2-C-methyl-D-erythritol 4-phosphate cytidylyltransferase, partial [Clostridia bacterium]